MEDNLKLYMVLLGCTPKGRLTEQHDIFFGIGTSVKELIADMYTFWPDGGQLHVDAWREVTHVNGFRVAIAPKSHGMQGEKLFFINLGGYKPGEFEEYHYKTIIAAKTMGEAVKAAKASVFYKHYNLKGGGESHIDDKHSLDADDMHSVNDVLLPKYKERYTITLTPTDVHAEDKLHIGYLKLGKKPSPTF